MLMRMLCSHCTCHVGFSRHTAAKGKRLRRATKAVTNLLIA